MKTITSLKIMNYGDHDKVFLFRFKNGTVLFSTLGI